MLDGFDNQNCNTLPPLHGAASCQMRVPMARTFARHSLQRESLTQDLQLSVCWAQRLKDSGQGPVCQTGAVCLKRGTSCTGRWVRVHAQCTCCTCSLVTLTDRRCQPVRHTRACFLGSCTTRFLHLKTAGGTGAEPVAMATSCATLMATWGGGHSPSRPPLALAPHPRATAPMVGGQGSAVVLALARGGQERRL